MVTTSSFKQKFSHIFLNWSLGWPFSRKSLFISQCIGTILIECVYYHVNLLQNIKYMPSFYSGNCNDWYVDQQTLKKTTTLKHPFKTLKTSMKTLHTIWTSLKHPWTFLECPFNTPDTPLNFIHNSLQKSLKYLLHFLKHALTLFTHIWSIL